MEPNPSNINEEDRKIRIDLILHLKREKEKEKIAAIEEEKRLDEELQKLKPNAFERLMSVKKSRGMQKLSRKSLRIKNPMIFMSS